MSALRELHRGWDMPYLEQIKMCIRSMPYGDTITLARAAGVPTALEADEVAKALWKWANNGDTNTKEQTTEE